MAPVVPAFKYVRPGSKSQFVCRLSQNFSSSAAAVVALLRMPSSASANRGSRPVCSRVAAQAAPAAR
jgi:hypothetical protein